MYKRQVSVEDRCHGLQYHDSKLCVSGRQVGGLLSYLSHHVLLSGCLSLCLSVTAFTATPRQGCYYYDPRTLLFLSSVAAGFFYSIRHLRNVMCSTTQTNGRGRHYMPMTASCVRKVPPFLLRPNTSTDFHSFPSFFRSFTTFS